MDFKLQLVSLDNWPFTQIGIAYGKGRLSLEVLYSEHDRIPSPAQLRSAWKKRENRRGNPLLVVVLHSKKAYVCGPAGEDPPIYSNLDAGQVERACKEALEQPSRQAALRSLRDSLGSLEDNDLPGLRNEGFLASHELITGVPNRSDWSTARDKAHNSLGLTGKDLLLSLDFTIDPIDNVTDVLRANDLKTAVAVLLTERETPEASSERIPGNISPVSYAMHRAKEESLDWVILVHGRKIRLYPVNTGIGVGRRGSTETFLECHTGLIPDDQAAYLWLLFSADALTESGSLSSILADSEDYAGDLASRLRDRIYVEVIPRLAEGLAEARGLTHPTAQDLSDTYQMAMWTLFRILFIAYGEDKDLLPYRFNGLYQKRSLKAKAKDLLELTHSGEGFGEGDTWWEEVKAIFKAVDKGNPSWGVPAYNGGLFSRNPTISPIGAKLEEVSLPDSVFGPALEHLLLVPTAEGVLGPVDFRSLGVREFGTIYEGLLESELSVAETDLTVQTTGKSAGTYRPCKEGEEPDVAKGKVYLHNASGARKSTGSYYTKHFAVEHLLDRALEPALTDHFERLDALDELEAAESFFDFRVADIAMGSGHFLVAAVDRIETRFASYLAKRTLPFVAQELDHLRKAALDALGDAAGSYSDLEDNALLRRLIARRCIYGVDINAVAVQLARLGIWIHTFVPGLPLSFLDRNLVHGNSLVGVGDLSELVEKVKEETPLFETTAADFVGDASDALTRLGRLTDASPVEVQEARKAWADADKATAPAKALCDILTAARIEAESLPFDFTRWQEKKASVVGGKDHQHALEVLKDMHALHFPVAFPEVFLRDRAGFDVILGNPPWEKARVEEHGFWARFVPGLRGLNQRERGTQIQELRDSRPDLVRELDVEVKTTRAVRNALSRGPFPGMGTGDPDLYKAFCWRFWFLTGKDGGRVGVVLPRSALSAKGSEEFRWRILKKRGEIDVTVLKNIRGWLFEDVSEQYGVAFVCIQRGGRSSSRVELRGVYRNLGELESMHKTGSACFSGDECLSWNDSASLPTFTFPPDKSVDVFRQLRKAPRLDMDDGEVGQWSARPYREFETYMRDKMTFTKEQPDGHWPILPGKSFNHWLVSRWKEYAWIDPEVAIGHYEKKRERGRNLASSVFSKFETTILTDPESLPCLHPRIAFRDVARATDARTVIAALVPSRTICVETAPVFMFPRGDHADVAYLLGVLCSIPLDWYARRFVENHVKLGVIKCFPIPRPARENPLRLRNIEISARLTSVDERFADWAKEVGVECGPLEDDEKQDMIHELDAVVAHLYGLTEDHLSHIFETFHVGWDYNARLEETLKHHQTWAARS